MRVVLLGENACHGDAIGRQVAAKVRFFRERGDDVRVLLTSALRVHPDVRPYSLCTTADTLWADLRQREMLLGADLVLADFGGYYDLIDLLPACNSGRARIIFNYHGVTPSRLADGSLRQKLRLAEEKRNLVWCADLAWVHSRFMARELHQATGYPLERIQVAPCLVELASPSDPADADSLRKRHGLQNATIMLYVGRVAPNKRISFLIDAVARLSGRSPATHLVVVGDDTDLYAHEALRCHEKARQLGLSDRVHFVGRVAEGELAAWYRAADVFVLPSIHEGFGLPAVEAMASGVPVVVARAGSLPETVGGAGLSFEPDDVVDLVRQIERVLESRESRSRIQHRNSGEFRYGVNGKVAIVTPRFGADVVGGAERSLGLMARALQRAGHGVEVFTTCNRDDAVFGNHHREGDEDHAGLLVHRHSIDDVDRTAFENSLGLIRSARIPIPDEISRIYWHNSLRSSSLIEALARRQSEFKAIVTGPYLFGLTLDVARAFGERVLVAPCFHDEALAHLPECVQVYSKVGGLLYHTHTEQRFAESELGINHPNAQVIGTWLDDATPPGQPDRGRKLGGETYVVYCGRYSAEKGLDRLLDYVAAFNAARGGGVKLVLMGQGHYPLPRVPWLMNLGFVNEQTKRDVLAGALALVILSANESLSLVTLEAWREGTPVIGHRESAVVCELVEQAGGGHCVRDAEDFIATVQDLLARPTAWQEAGERGRQFVLKHYASEQRFLGRLKAGIQGLTEPLHAQLSRLGPEHARDFGYEPWRSRMEAIVATALALPGRQRRPRLALALLGDVPRVAVGSPRAMLTVRVTNDGDAPAVDTGPIRQSLMVQTYAEDAAKPASVSQVPLPHAIVPGQSAIVLAPFPVPEHPGKIEVVIGSMHDESRAEVRCMVEVTEQAVLDQGEIASVLADGVRGTLAEALANQTLPDDYQDVTLGVLAGVKRRVKQKLLHNFRKAYVEVMAQQQSTFNAQVIMALKQLTDAVTVVDRQGQQDWSKVVKELQEVVRNQDKLMRRVRSLERRLRRLEAPVESRARGQRAVAGS